MTGNGASGPIWKNVFMYRQATHVDLVTKNNGGTATELWVGDSARMKGRIIKQDLCYKSLIVTANPAHVMVSCSVTERSFQFDFLRLGKHRQL